MAGPTTTRATRRRAGVARRGAAASHGGRPLALAALLGLAVSACAGAPAPATTVTVTAATTVTVTAPAAATPTGSDPVPLPAGHDPAGRHPGRDEPDPSRDAAGGRGTAADAPVGAPADAPSGPSGAADLAQDLEDALDRVDASGRLGVALAPVGGGPVTVAGPERSNLAWSTIKVPIAVAALAASDRASTRALARRAITVSDNAAAQALFQRAGPTAVEDVVRELGDDTTQVDPLRYGRTSWTLEDQARFAAGLPCRAVAAPVLELMGEIDPAQRWGLGRLDGARFKGGWGPQTDGYVARQLGVIDAGDRGQVGVAVMSRTAGGMAGATADLDRVADLLRERLDRLPAGRCPGPDEDHEQAEPGDDDTPDGDAGTDAGTRATTDGWRARDEGGADGT